MKGGARPLAAKLSIPGLTWPNVLDVSKGFVNGSEDEVGGGCCEPLLVFLSL